MSDRFAKQGLTVLAGFFIASVFILFFKIFFVRLSVELFGVYQLLYGIFQLIALFAIIGLNTGLARFVPMESSKLKAVKHLASSYAISFSLAVVICFLTVFFAKEFFGGIFGGWKYLPHYKLFMFALPVYVLYRLNIAWQAGVGDSVKFTLLKDFAPATILLSTISAVLFFNLNPILVFIVFPFTYLILFIASYFLLDVKLDFTKYDFSILRFSAPLLAVDLSHQLMAYTDTVILGLYHPMIFVGRYNAALIVARFLSFAPVSLLAFFLPTLMEYKRRKTDFSIIFSSVNRWITFFNAPLLALFIMYPNNVVGLIFQRFIVDVKTPLIILSLGLFTHFFLVSSRRLLIAFDDTKYVGYVVGLSAFTNLILNLILIPKYALAGAAFATSFSLIMAGAILAKKALKKYGLHLFECKILKIMCCAVFCLIPVLLLDYFSIELYTPLIDDILKLIFYAVVYTLAVFATKSYTVGDKEIIKSVFNF